MDCPLVLVGWKQIREALGGMSHRTAKSWVTDLGIPVKYVKGRPTITLEALNAWWKNLPDFVEDKIVCILPED